MLPPTTKGSPWKPIVAVDLELRNPDGDMSDTHSIDDVRFVTIPEPGSVVLAAIALIGLAVCARRRRRD